MFLIRLLSIAALLTLPLRADAESIDSLLAGGIFPLANHPDGNAAPPLYGFRLDGLDGVSGHRFTFDFEGPGANMIMDFEGVDGILRIFGTAFGGRIENHAYVDPQLWEIDFLYTKMILDGGRLVSDPTSATNIGTIIPGAVSPSGGGSTAGAPIDLIDYFGTHPFTFALEENHRGFDGVSGFGWLNHSGAGLDNHVASSDWLFTVIPEPRTDALLLVGLAAVILAARLRPRTTAR